MVMKICTRCKVEKLISEFSKRKARQDGLLGHCKNCTDTYAQNVQRYSAATKVCTRCEVEKHASEFPKCKATSDGLQTYSKNCAKAYHAKWQEDNREHLREYNTNRYNRLAQLNRVRVY